MNVRVTSITWSDVGEMVRSVTSELQENLKAPFQGLSFGAGITQLTITIISASQDEAEQKRLCKGYSKIGTFRHLVSKARIKFIGLAIPVSPDSLARMERLELRTFVCRVLLERLAKPDLRIPKEFDYETFSRTLGGAIAKFCPEIIS